MYFIRKKTLNADSKYAAYSKHLGIQISRLWSYLLPSIWYFSNTCINQLPLFLGGIFQRTKGSQALNWYSQALYSDVVSENPYLSSNLLEYICGKVLVQFQEQCFMILLCNTKGIWHPEKHIKEYFLKPSVTCRRKRT